MWLLVSLFHSVPCITLMRPVGSCVVPSFFVSLHHCHSHCEYKASGLLCSKKKEIPRGLKGDRSFLLDFFTGLGNSLLSLGGEPWTRDGGVPQGCHLSMMFIVALYLPWCRYLSAQEGVEPQLYADNLKCVSRDPDLLLNATRFTTGNVRLVGQEPAPSILLSTSREVRKDMKGWVLSCEGDQWSVKSDVWDLGGHLDTTFRGWSSTLAARVRLVISRLVLIFVLPLDFHGRVRVV